MALYIPPQAKAQVELELLHDFIDKQMTDHPEDVVIVVKCDLPKQRK